MRIIAKLDVKPPAVVKPVHFEGLRKVGSPQQLAKDYYDQGADEVLYLDIVASLYQRDILFDQVEAAAQQLFVPFAVGGGVKSLEDMSRLFHCGADKVVINTHVLQQDPNLIDQAARAFGSQSVVIAVESKRMTNEWECLSDCGRQPSGKKVLDWVAEVQERGAGELVLQSVDHDGRQRGFDIELLGAVCDRVSLPVIAASGAGSLEDIVELCTSVQVDAVAIASLLHYQKCQVADIKTALANAGIEVVL
jgi:cyclase